MTLPARRISDLPTAGAVAEDDILVVVQAAPETGATATYRIPVSAIAAALALLHSHDHDGLAGLQGGAAGDRWHLTAVQLDGLTGGDATSLHGHAEASPEAAGYLSTADKVKLDALPASAVAAAAGAAATAAEAAGDALDAAQASTAAGDAAVAAAGVATGAAAQALATSQGFAGDLDGMTRAVIALAAGWIAAEARAVPSYAFV